MSLWYIRIFFWVLCSLAGMAISQVRPETIGHGGAIIGLLFGFGFGGILIAIDEMLKGFSLRAFSATTFGLILGCVIAFLVDHSGMFEQTDSKTRWLIRLALFLGCGYIGMVLAMRSNKEDFSLIIPYVRFSQQHKPDNLLLLDTSVIIDGRIADLIESRLLEGLIVVPRFVLKELQQIGDSNDPIRRARGRRGLDMLNRLQRSTAAEVKIHDGDFPEEKEVDAKLVRLARNLNAKLFTNDYNLGKIAELQSVAYVNIHEVAKGFKTVVIPGEMFHLRLVREGKDKDQAVGYLPDGTMVVVNHGHSMIGQDVDVQVQSLLQTGAGIIVFAEIKSPVAPKAA
ncbi:MAG TPA: PIN domain-containing protein [Verrucomicrobiae bacterium]|jgi:uncharacterized protein YacL|nr:PIN domain-containing protein [Verrucomicrobiae bacterium]